MLRPMSWAARARARRRAVPAALLALAVCCAASPGPAAAAPYHPAAIASMPNLPDVTAAAPADRSHARALLRRSRRAAAMLMTVGSARSAGFRADGPWRHDGMRHFTRRANLRDPSVLDPRRPEGLVFMRMDGGGTMLAALVFRMPSSRRPPHPAGPIVRWHVHTRCVKRDRRDPRQVSDPLCDGGTVMHYGRTQMTHVWFARGLANAFANHAPMDTITGP
jgi:hypothetical protein